MARPQQQDGGRPEIRGRRGKRRPATAAAAPCTPAVRIFLQPSARERNPRLRCPWHIVCLPLWRRCPAFRTLQYALRTRWQVVDDTKTPRLARHLPCGDTRASAPRPVSDILIAGARITVACCSLFLARTPALRSLGTSGKWAAPAKAQRAWKPCGQSHSCCDSWATSSCCGCHCDQVKRQTFHPVKDVGGGPWRLFGSVCLVQCASNLCVQRLLMGNLLAGVREKNCRGNTRHLHPSLELANHFQPGSRWRHEDLFVRLVAA